MKAHKPLNGHAVRAEVPDRPTILLVDDTPANLNLLSEVLKPEYRIKAAVSGEKALRLAAAAGPPDMILLDIMMPGMDGYEVCRRLKGDPATRDIPVIFVTAMNDEADEAKGLALGGVDYLTKPISAAIVKARIRTHLLLHAQARAMALLIGKLEAQATELSDFNHTLEQRVRDAVGELEQLGRLKRYFSVPVVDWLLSGAAEDPLKTHRREVAAVFLDLRGYTAFTETSDPEDVMGVIGEYHEAMGAIVLEHGGTIERFAGDGIMIFFNDPVEIANPAAQAVRMTIEMHQRFARLAHGWKNRGYDLAMGIGVAQGYATIGTIGFEGRRDYGVIGTVTNLAARLCGEAAAGQTLISQRVRGLVADRVETASVGHLALKGFHRPVEAFAVVGYATVDAPRPDDAAANQPSRRASDRVAALHAVNIAI